jgi:signal peptidase I
VEQKKEKSSFLKSLASFVREILVIVAISAAIAIPIRIFLFQPFYVKGASMEPNFYDHEYLIIDEITYRFREPRRGEVIVFRSPENPKQYYIKRLIALPGERIRIAEKKIIIYNKIYPQGIELDESSYLPLIEIQGTLGEVDRILKENEYFVLGDNRNSSLDSRSFGPVLRENIIGRAFLRGWPFDRFEIFLERPYNF